MVQMKVDGERKNRLTSSHGEKNAFHRVSLYIIYIQRVTRINVIDSKSICENSENFSSSL